ncbi:MAG: alpha/beta fold hydrolase [bacterium]|nr:alpha/beta fold hydrolase [bacterium]
MSAIGRLACGVAAAALLCGAGAVGATDPGSAGREFVTLLSDGRFGAAIERLDDALRSSTTIGGLADTWMTFVARLGDFRGIAGTRTEAGEEGDTVFVTCEFQRACVDAKVVLDRGGRVAGLEFLPSPVPPRDVPPLHPMPGRFVEREVAIGTGEWEFPGTLATPVGEKACCGVVLVHGFGAQDRDESFGPNRPFRDIAWGLAARGIAVLRYEKRLRHHAGKIEPVRERITAREETIDDALAAVRFLRGVEGVDPRRIFVLGHGLGGMLLPRIGASDREIAGFVILAGTARPLEDVLLEQMTYILSLREAPAGESEAALERFRAQVAKVKDQALSAETPSSALPLDIPAGYWLDLRGYDPPAAAARLGRPLLVVQGGRDYLSTVKDFEAWRGALDAAPGARLRLYPRHNHLFVDGEGKCTPDDLLVPRKMDDAVLDDIASWIREAAARAGTGAERP